MNRCASKAPLCHGQKLRKMWEGKFYLSPADREELVARIETNVISREVDGIAFIDERGEWL